MKHKPINEQVVVITGASSGIGLCTALLAAERGAEVVLGFTLLVEPSLLGRTPEPANRPVSEVRIS